MTPMIIAAKSMLPNRSTGVIRLPRSIAVWLPSHATKHASMSIASGLGKSITQDLALNLQSEYSSGFPDKVSKRPKVRVSTNE